MRRRRGDVGRRGARARVAARGRGVVADVDEQVGTVLVVRWIEVHDSLLGRMEVDEGVSTLAEVVQLRQNLILSEKSRASNC